MYIYIYIYLCATIDIANFIPRTKVWFSLPNAQNWSRSRPRQRSWGVLFRGCGQQIWEVHQESIEHTHTHTHLYTVYIYNVGKIIIYHPFGNGLYHL